MSDLLSAAGPEGTVAGLLALALLGFLAAVSKGLLVPRSHVVDVQEAADKRAGFAEDTSERRVKEAREDTNSRLVDVYGQRDDWREAFRASDARADILATQVGVLVNEVRTVTDALKALTRVDTNEVRHD